MPYSVYALVVYSRIRPINLDVLRRQVSKLTAVKHSFRSPSSSRLLSASAVRRMRLRAPPHGEDLGEREAKMRQEWAKEQKAAERLHVFDKFPSQGKTWLMLRQSPPPVASSSELNAEEKMGLLTSDQLRCFPRMLCERLIPSKPTDH